MEQNLTQETFQATVEAVTRMRCLSHGPLSGRQEGREGKGLTGHGVLLWGSPDTQLKVHSQYCMCLSLPVQCPVTWLLTYMKAFL
jgi:hypothetical protein